MVIKFKVYKVVVEKIEVDCYYIFFEVVVFVKEIGLLKFDLIVEVVLKFVVDLCKVD